METFGIFHPYDQDFFKLLDSIIFDQNYEDQNYEICLKIGRLKGGVQKLRT